MIFLINLRRHPQSILFPYTTLFRSINSDQYQSERKIIDAKISYRLNKNLTFFADVINLGEEPLDEYAGYPNRNQRSEEHTSELQSPCNLVCRLLLEKKNKSVAPSEM